MTLLDKKIRISPTQQVSLAFMILHVKYACPHAPNFHPYYRQDSHGYQDRVAKISFMGYVDSYLNVHCFFWCSKWYVMKFFSGLSNKLIEILLKHVSY